MDRDIDPSRRRRDRLRRAAPAAVAALAAAALLAALPGWLRPSLDRGRLRTAIVERGEVVGVVEATGEVRPSFEGAISSPVEARVERILRQPGERVAAGEALLELDTAQARLELARLDERLAGLASSAEQRRRRLLREEGDLGGELESRRLDLELATLGREQQARLHAEGLASLETLRQAEVGERKAGIELAGSERRLAAARQEAAAELAAFEREARLLAEERASSARQLELATTRADRAGVVTWIVPQAGVTVRRGEVVARLADLSAFSVEATVSDVHAARLAAGLPAVVEVADNRISGRVAVVYPTIEGGVARFRVELDEPSHPALRDRLRVDVGVELERRPDVLRLPRGPYLQGGREQRLFVVAGDRAVRRTTAVGLAGADFVEVAGGLAAGEVVIVSDMSDFLHASEVGIDD